MLSMRGVVANANTWRGQVDSTCGRSFIIQTMSNAVSTLRFINQSKMVHAQCFGSPNSRIIIITSISRTHWANLVFYRNRKNWQHHHVLTVMTYRSALVYIHLFLHLHVHSCTFYASVCCLLLSIESSRAV